jgi:hypothetical protein
MSDPTGGNPEQVCRLFFSLDLVNATRFKYGKSPRFTESSDPDAWPSIFIEFFNLATETFWNNASALIGAKTPKFNAINLWKTLGDEILFYSEQTSALQPYWQIRAFYQTIANLNDDWESEYGYQLGVKGTAWSAGFPIRNKRVFLDSSSRPAVYEGNEDTLTYRTGVDPSSNSTAEFMGLELDQGFRLSQYSYPGRLLCSPDACYLAAKAFQQEEANRTSFAESRRLIATNVAEQPEFRVFLVGWRRLKGVLGESPIPVLWPEFLSPDADQLGKRRLRFTFEPGESEFIQEYQEAKPMSATQYREFFEAWSRDLRRLKIDHILPYIMADPDMPDEHRSLFPKFPDGKMYR